MNILLQQLATIGCLPHLVKFIKFITFQRQIFTDQLGETFRYTYKGLPQGGVMSPILYDIYDANTCKNLPKSVPVSKFADDIAIYCTRGTYTKCLKILENSINIISKNLPNLGLDISPQKWILLNSSEAHGGAQALKHY